MTFRQVFTAVYLPLLGLCLAMGAGKALATGHRPGDVWFYFVLSTSPVISAFIAWVYVREITRKGLTDETNRQQDHD